MKEHYYPVEYPLDYQTQGEWEMAKKRAEAYFKGISKPIEEDNFKKHIELAFMSGVQFVKDGLKK